MTKPIVREHDGIFVVRDDLFPGGTKARFLPILFEGADEVVYASPCQGGAQTALAHTAAKLGKRATIFVAKRKQPHDRTLEAKRLGARIFQVPAGYLNVVKARARKYAHDTGSFLAPFGVDLPEAIRVIGEAALSTGLEPDEIWCASGSGVLARSLKYAFPNARLNCVQVGRELTPADVGGAAKIWVHPLKFDQVTKAAAPFPSDGHYDRKAWEFARKHAQGRQVLFWNVTGPAVP